MIFLTKEEDFQYYSLTSLYFYASWMPFHKKMLQMIHKMEEKYPDIKFIAIDIEYFKTFCKRFEITSIPVILVFDQGKEILRINGIPLTSALRSAFSDIFKNGESHE